MEIGCEDQSADSTEPWLERAANSGQVCGSSPHGPTISLNSRSSELSRKIANPNFAFETKSDVSARADWLACVHEQTAIADCGLIRPLCDRHWGSAGGRDEAARRITGEHSGAFVRRVRDWRRRYGIGLRAGFTAARVEDCAARRRGLCERRVECGDQNYSWRRSLSRGGGEASRSRAIRGGEPRAARAHSHAAQRSVSFAADGISDSLRWLDQRRLHGI